MRTGALHTDSNISRAVIQCAIWLTNDSIFKIVISKFVEILYLLVFFFSIKCVYTNTKLFFCCGLFYFVTFVELNFICCTFWFQESFFLQKKKNNYNSLPSNFFVFLIIVPFLLVSPRNLSLSLSCQVFCAILSFAFAFIFSCKWNKKKKKT